MPGVTLPDLVRAVTTIANSTQARVLLAHVAEQLTGHSPESTVPSLKSRDAGRALTRDLGPGTRDAEPGTRDLSADAEVFARQLCRWALEHAELTPAQQAAWEQVVGPWGTLSPASRVSGPKSGDAGRALTRDAGPAGDVRARLRDADWLWDTVGVLILTALVFFVLFGVAGFRLEAHRSAPPPRGVTHHEPE